MRPASIIKYRISLENMTCEGVPLEVAMREYGCAITELLSSQAQLAIKAKSHLSPFIVWDGANVFESPATSVDELESYLLEQRGKIHFYFGQDADGTPTENKLSVQKRMSDYCRIERCDEKITLENMKTKTAVSGRQISKELWIARNIPALLAQNPLWKVRESEVNNDMSEKQQSESIKNCDEEAERNNLTVVKPPKTPSRRGLQTHIIANNQSQPGQSPASTSVVIKKPDGMLQKSKRIKPESDPNEELESRNLQNEMRSDFVHVSKTDVSNSIPKKDQTAAKLYSGEKLAPINMDDLLTSPDSQLLDVDLRDIFTLKAFVEELDSADRASLYELLPEVDTQSATNVASLFTANMQFLSALSLYRRLLGSGAYDPSLISKARNKRRRLDNWNEEKEHAFNAFYGHRVDDQPGSSELSSKWSMLDEMVVENIIKSTRT